VFEQRQFLRFHNAVNSGRTVDKSFFKKSRRQAPVKSAIAKIIKKFRETGSVLDKSRNL
jgi:hypothetical protein